MSAAITKEQIERFVTAWFQALDQHLPLKEVRRFLADSDLEMVFPEKTVCNLDDFGVWYLGGRFSDGADHLGVTNIFFDEMHGVVSIESKIDGDHADLDVVVAWTTLWINPPEPTSKRILLHSTQQWMVRVSEENKNPYGLEIVSYKAELHYAPGSARLQI